MNTSQIEHACDGLSKFGGVVPIDVYVSSSKTNKMTVVNTDPSSLPGSHWFVVDKTLSPAVIFDSLGRLSPATQKDFWYRWSKKNVQPFTTFFPALQGPTTNVCGDYCILYIHLRHLGYSSQWIHNFLYTLALVLSKGRDTSHLRDHIVRDSVREYFVNDAPSKTHVLPVFNQICTAYQ